MSKITISQFFAILLLGTGLSNHVIVVPLLLNAAGRDSCLVSRFVTLKETTMWTDETNLFQTPTILIAALLIGASFYISLDNVKVIAICAPYFYASLELILRFIGLFIAIFLPAF
ncbi:hypothetical protein [Gracilibacillus caseinilyticus]|uniref:hypothetical protein n=1 Tax=Gracilibacillus caseinilyticus TaxID=2932256 RepID=UPI00350E92F9